MHSLHGIERPVQFLRNMSVIQVRNDMRMKKWQQLSNYTGNTVYINKTNKLKQSISRQIMNTHIFIILRKDTKNQCDESTSSQCYTHVSHPVVQRGDSHPVGQQTLQTHEQNACWEGGTCTYIVKCFCMVHLVEKQCSVIQIIINQSIVK